MVCESQLRLLRRYLVQPPKIPNARSKFFRTAIRSLAHRAFSIPMNDKDLQHEIEIIHYLAHKNGFPTYLTSKIIEQQKEAINKNTSTQRNNNNVDKNVKTFVPLTYFNRASNEIGKVIKRFGYTPAFRTKYNCNNYIRNINKEQCDKYDKPGVYKIECSSCTSIYIGKTERNIRTRFNEHLQKSNSNVYKHVYDENHIINNLNNNVNVLHNSNDRYSLRTLEKYEIRRAMLNDENMLNVQLDLNLAGNTLIDECCTLP